MIQKLDEENLLSINGGMIVQRDWFTGKTDAKRNGIYVTRYSVFHDNPSPATMNEIIWNNFHSAIGTFDTYEEAKKVAEANNVSSKIFIQKNWKLVSEV